MSVELHPDIEALDKSSLCYSIYSQLYHNFFNLGILHSGAAYAIMAIAKKEVVSKWYTKRKPRSVTSGAFFRLVVTVVSV